MESSGLQLRTARPRARFPRSQTFSGSPSPPPPRRRSPLDVPIAQSREGRYESEYSDIESDSSLNIIVKRRSPSPRPRRHRPLEVPFAQSRERRYESEYSDVESEISSFSASTASSSRPPRLQRAATMPTGHPRTSGRVEDARTSSPSPAQSSALPTSSKLGRLSRTDKRLLGFQASETSVRSTISRDNTAGEHARHASLFAQYGKKVGPKGHGESGRLPLRQTLVVDTSSKADDKGPSRPATRVSSVEQTPSHSAEPSEIRFARTYGPEDVSYSYRPPRRGNEKETYEEKLDMAAEYIRRSRGKNRSRKVSPSPTGVTRYRINPNGTTERLSPTRAKPSHMLRGMER